jgi:hypothetical protein
MSTSVELELNKYLDEVKHINTITESCTADFFSKIEPHMQAFLRGMIENNLNNGRDAYTFQFVQPRVDVDKQLFLMDEIYRACLI